MDTQNGNNAIQRVPVHVQLPFDKLSDYCRETKSLPSLPNLRLKRSSDILGGWEKGRTGRAYVSLDKIDIVVDDLDPWRDMWFTDIIVESLSLDPPTSIPHPPLLEL